MVGVSLVIAIGSYPSIGWIFPSQGGPIIGRGRAAAVVIHVGVIEGATALAGVAGGGRSGHTNVQATEATIKGLILLV